MTNQLLLDKLSRSLLCDFLTDRSIARPPTIPEGMWRQILAAEATAVDLEYFAAIMDGMNPWEGSRLMDMLRLHPDDTKGAASSSDRRAHEE